MVVDNAAATQGLWFVYTLRYLPCALWHVYIPSSNLNLNMICTATTWSINAPSGMYPYFHLLLLYLLDSKTGLLLCLPANLQRKVIELLHHVKQIPLDVLKQLALCCHDNRMHIESVTYLLQILTMSQMNDAPCAAFFSFLFSVNLGKCL